MRYYTIRELSNKTGLKIYRIRHLIKKNKIRSVKGKGPNSPYKIPDTEVKKLLVIAEENVSISKESQPRIEKTEEEGKSKLFEEFIEIQKTLAETMRDLASTQEKIATTLREMVKRV